MNSSIKPLVEKYCVVLVIFLKNLAIANSIFTINTDVIFKLFIDVFINGTYSLIERAN